MKFCTRLQLQRKGRWVLLFAAHSIDISGVPRGGVYFFNMFYWACSTTRGSTTCLFSSYIHWFHTFKSAKSIDSINARNCFLYLVMRSSLLAGQVVYLYICMYVCMCVFMYVFPAVWPRNLYLFTPLVPPPLTIYPPAILHTNWKRTPGNFRWYLNR